MDVYTSIQASLESSLETPFLSGIKALGSAGAWQLAHAGGRGASLFSLVKLSVLSLASMASLLIPLQACWPWDDGQVESKKNGVVTASVNGRRVPRLKGSWRSRKQEALCL